MREIFRRHQGLLPESIDLMFVARSQVNNWPFAQLDRAFADACARMASPSAP